MHQFIFSTNFTTSTLNSQNYDKSYETFFKVKDVINQNSNGIIVRLNNIDMIDKLDPSTYVMLEDNVHDKSKKYLIIDDFGMLLQTPTPIIATLMHMYSNGIYIICDSDDDFDNIWSRLLKRGINIFHLTYVVDNQDSNIESYVGLCAVYAQFFISFLHNGIKLCFNSMNFIPSKSALRYKLYVITLNAELYKYHTLSPLKYFSHSLLVKLPLIVNGNEYEYSIFELAETMSGECDESTVSCVSNSPWAKFVVDAFEGYANKSVDAHLVQISPSTIAMLLCLLNSVAYSGRISKAIAKILHGTRLFSEKMIEELDPYDVFFILFGYLKLDWYKNDADVLSEIASVIKFDTKHSFENFIDAECTMCDIMSDNKVPQDILDIVNSKETNITSVYKARYRSVRNTPIDKLHQKTLIQEYKDKKVMDEKIGSVLDNKDNIINENKQAKLNEKVEIDAKEYFENKNNNKIAQAPVVHKERTIAEIQEETFRQLKELHSTEYKWTMMEELVKKLNRFPMEDFRQYIAGTKATTCNNKLRAIKKIVDRKHKPVSSAEYVEVKSKSKKNKKQEDPMPTFDHQQKKAESDDDTDTTSNNESDTSSKNDTMVEENNSENSPTTMNEVKDDSLKNTDGNSSNSDDMVLNINDGQVSIQNEISNNTLDAEDMVKNNNLEDAEDMVKSDDKNEIIANLTEDVKRDDIKEDLAKESDVDNIENENDELLLNTYHTQMHDDDVGDDTDGIPIDREFLKLTKGLPKLGIRDKISNILNYDNQEGRIDVKENKNDKGSFFTENEPDILHSVLVLGSSDGYVISDKNARGLVATTGFIINDLPLYKSEIKGLNEKFEMAKNELKELQSHLREMIDQQKDVNTCNDAVKKLRDELQEKESKLNESSNQIEELKKLNQTHQEKVNELSKIVDENVALKDKYDELDKMSRQCYNKLDEITAKHNELLVQMEDQDKNHESEKKKLVEEYENKLNDMAMSIDEQLNDYQIKSDSDDAEIIKLNDTIDAKNKRIEKLLGDISENNILYDELRDKYNKQKSAITDMESELNILREQNKHYEMMIAGQTKAVNNIVDNNVKSVDCVDMSIGTEVTISDAEEQTDIDVIEKIEYDKINEQLKTLTDYITSLYQTLSNHDDESCTNLLEMMAYMHNKITKSNDDEDNVDVTSNGSEFDQLKVHELLIKDKDYSTKNSTEIEFSDTHLKIAKNLHLRPTSPLNYALHVHALSKVQHVGTDTVEHPILLFADNVPPTTVSANEVIIFKERCPCNESKTVHDWAIDGYVPLNIIPMLCGTYCAHSVRPININDIPLLVNDKFINEEESMSIMYRLLSNA